MAKDSLWSWYSGYVCLTMTDFSFGQNFLHLPISPRGVWRHVEALGYWLNSAASRYDQPTLSRVHKQMVWCISEIKPGSRWYISWIIELDSGWLLSFRTTSAWWSLLIKQWEHQIVQQHWDCLQLKPLVPNNKITPAHSKSWVRNAVLPALLLWEPRLLSPGCHSPRGKQFIAPTSHNYPMLYRLHRYAPAYVDSYQPPKNRRAGRFAMFHSTLRL